MLVNWELCTYESNPLHDNSAFKVVFLAIEAASKRWTMPIRNWPQAMNQFIILHEDRLKDYV